MKKYKTGEYGELIKEVEIERETDYSVFIKTRYGHANNKISRELKSSHYTNYFDTMKEAKAFLKDKFNKRIESLTIQIKKTKKMLTRLSAY